MNKFLNHSQMLYERFTGSYTKGKYDEKPEKKEPEKVIGAALKNAGSSVNSPSKVRTESY